MWTLLHRPSLASKQPLNYPRLGLRWQGPPPAPPPPRASAAPTHLASFVGSGTFSTESGHRYCRYDTGTGISSTGAVNPVDSNIGTVYTVPIIRTRSLSNSFGTVADGLVACPSRGLTAICMIWDQNLACFRDFGRYCTYRGTIFKYACPKFDTPLFPSCNLSFGQPPFVSSYDWKLFPAYARCKWRFKLVPQVCAIFLVGKRLLVHVSPFNCMIWGFSSS